MEHPILHRIHREGFVPLGWFAATESDRIPEASRFVILIGNAGPSMFERFAREAKPGTHPMDAWTRSVVDPLAKDLGAAAIYPFDKPAQPFLTWARRAGAGHISPLGLNIHPVFGLWHAYRAALLFPVVFDLPTHAGGGHPCNVCAEKPCLSACPVNAFDGKSYDVDTCDGHLSVPAGADCMAYGCKARLACPVGPEFRYSKPQMEFHMQAFLEARQAKRA